MSNAPLTPAEIEAAKTMAQDQGDHVRRRMEGREFMEALTYRWTRQYSMTGGTGNGWFLIWLWRTLKNPLAKLIFIIVLAAGALYSIIIWLT